MIMFLTFQIVQKDKYYAEQIYIHDYYHSTPINN